MKKILIGLLCLSSFTLTPCATLANNADVSKTNSRVIINGEYKYFDAYNIADNNYFKLRDIAYSLNGSSKQFDVRWNEQTNSIDLVSGVSYTEVGGEMQNNYSYSAPTAVPTSSSIYLDGQQIELTAYNINNNNYFKLRDIGKALDFSVEWNESSQNIDIETAYGYSDEQNNTYELVRGVDAANTNTEKISNWAKVSSVQQFKYMDKGLAYAYADDNKLNMVTPDKQLQVEMKYPLLGDVISDDDGNFYVVWGARNNNDSYDTETVFISKYSAEGQHLKTTGFVGESKMGADGNTKIPFDAGNCSSAIGNGYLMVNYAREMYSGHQSNNVIGVSLDDMSPVKFDSKWDIPYTSHSFNQRVIWSELANDFVYADHGDAYSRGFTVTANKNEKTVFTFYLEANANYNMYVVNKTFAQLGGLAETSDGVVLVGASAKSISENAKEEKQNLFIQVFDPTSKDITKSMFVGGEERSGATSLDINDNQNSPLTPVTDYGVHWITNYTDRDVIAPHAVVADNRIVILWNENKDGKTEAFYTILSSSGDVVKAPASLGVGRKLNSNEEPIYHNGAIYWASSNNGKIRVDFVEID